MFSVGFAHLSLRSIAVDGMSQSAFRHANQNLYGSEWRLLSLFLLLQKPNSS